MRTVVLVLIGQAAIDSGGLKYFFENDWFEGVTYSHFADAYSPRLDGCCSHKAGKWILLVNEPFAGAREIAAAKYVAGWSANTGMFALIFLSPISLSKCGLPMIRSGGGHRFGTGRFAT